MPRSDDLAARIARLEEVLDRLEQSRRAAAAPREAAFADDAPSPLDRLRDVMAVLQERATHSDCDEGDAIAMRALLEEVRSLTASLRDIASDVSRRLDGVGGAVDEARGRLKELEEIA